MLSILLKITNDFNQQIWYNNIMKNSFIVCISFLLINYLLTGCFGENRTSGAGQQRGITIEDGVLAVGVEVNYPPMEYYDTDGVTLLGFDIELTRALAEKLGLQVKFFDTAWEGILAGLDTNRYDIAVNVTVLPERQKRYNFTKPYIGSFMTIVTLKDSFLKIEKPEDIAGCRVAFQGNTTAQYFTERLANQGIKFTSFSYEKIINCFDDLRLKRVDFIVVDNIVAFHYAERDSGLFEVAWQGQADEFIAICLKKGNDTLTAALDDALDELTAGGAVEVISRRYFGE
jgi:polar amino acid transport system substrate-binding protein